MHNIRLPIPDTERDPETLNARWQELAEGLLAVVSKERTQTAQELMLVSGAAATSVNNYVGRHTEEQLATVSSPQILAFLFHGAACEKCGCKLYSYLDGYQACARCYPRRGYHRYQAIIDELYPQRRLHVVRDERSRTTESNWTL